MNRADACVRIAAHSLAARLHNTGISAPQFDRDQRRDPWMDALVSEAARDARQAVAELESLGLAQFEQEPPEDTIDGLGSELDELRARVDELRDRVEGLGDLRDMLEALRNIGAAIERQGVLAAHVGGSA